MNDLKFSFNPISNKNSTVLILGFMPGEQSLALQQYYAHPQNKFWKVIATITNSDITITYADKEKLLFQNNIALWDIIKYANREGSLDSAIKNEQPNNISDFIIKHKKLETICFNGKKAEALYRKYFAMERTINYISLPSISPANASINLENICIQWKSIFH